MRCSIVLVLSLAVVAACVEEEAPLDTEVAALASDPSTVTSSSLCQSNYTWNGIHARIYYPPGAAGCSESVYSPLVLIMPGAGFDQTVYHELAGHLARNRHIVVVVDTVAYGTGFLPPTAAQYQAAADTAWSFVTGYVWTSWPRHVYIDAGHVGLVGHSRGGEAVRYLAHALAADPIFDVRAVVDLAGTDQTNRYLVAGDALAALYLHGSMDGDVQPDRGYHAYDHTGNEGSQNDPGYSASVIEKTFKLLIGGDHPSFTEEEAGSMLDKPLQRAASKGYVLAFFKAWLANDLTWYADYIRGNAAPGGWIGGVFTQHSDGIMKRVIDHFEDGNNAGNALGGSVQKSAAIAWTSENLGLDAASPHATLAMGLAVTGAGWVQWNLPAGKRDASAFVSLSLRIGQRAGAASTTGVTVQVQNAAVWSAAIPLGAIEQPASHCAVDSTPVCLFEAIPIEPMGTIRVPLTAFGAHDDVRAVRLSFAGDAIGADLVIDSLEFAQWIFWP